MKAFRSGDTRSHLLAPDLIALEDPFIDEEWINVFRLVHHHVLQLRKMLKWHGSPLTSRNAPYLTRWMTLYAEVMDEHDDDHELVWESIVAMHFSRTNIENFQQFVQHVINLVPSVAVLMTVYEKDERVYIIVDSDWKSFNSDDSQVRAHENMMRDERYEARKRGKDEAAKETEQERANDSDEASTAVADEELKKKVDDLELKLENETRAIRDEIKNSTSDLKDFKTELKADLMTAISDGLKSAIGGDPQKYNEDLKKTLQDSEREYAKLQGDVKKTDEKLSDLRTQAASIEQLAKDATAKAKTAYTTHKLDFEAKNAELLTKMTQALANVANVKSSSTQYTQQSSSSQISPQYQKYYADEYKIDGEIYRIQSKKFQDDVIPIVCDSSDEMLGTYDLLRDIAANYGILLEDQKKITKWNKNLQSHPPTCPYEVSDFTNKQQYEQCYSKMKLALANKLKQSVEFGSNFLAADIIINNYALDGYKMLYELLSNSHPILKRDSAQQPTKPKFNGEMNEFIFKFKNYYTYKASRARPHFYDDYEKAEAVFYAIKNSRYYRDIKDGMNEAENYLHRWRLGGSVTAKFPPELELDAIAGTILQYYLERNKNPLPHSRGRSRERRSTTQTNDDSDNRGAAVRAAYYNRYGRNNNSSRSNSRSYSRGSNRSYNSNRRDSRSRNDRSNTPTRRATRKCEYCGGNHLTTTEYCPKLLDWVNLQDFVNNTEQREVERIVNDMQRDRARSISRSRSQSSQQSNQRGRSNNEDRSRSGTRR